MSNRKDYFSFIKKNKKKVACLAALMVCAGAFAATGKFTSDKAANEDIPIHDGDVLVDSLNVKDEESGEKGDAKDSELVTSDDVSELENKDTYFQELRATLDMDRNQIISMLTEAESSASTKAEKEEATAEKMRLLNYMEQEKTIETLIKNKNLPESFVVITDTGVNVTVNTDDLDQQTVTKICEIVMRQANVKASEIVVQDAS
ncbi:MAG: SpoIIIAH-like family protein [Anaerovoracaceae bacterium]